MKKNTFVALLIGAIASTPLAAAAHVKWFVDDSAPTVEPFTIGEPAVLIWTASFIATCIVAFVLQKRLKAPKWLTQLGSQRKELFLWIAHVLIGLWLVINAFSGVLFVPTLVIEAGLEPLLWLQGIAGIRIAARLYERLSSLLLVVLYIIASMLLGWVDMIEHFFILGIALWLVIQDSTHSANEWAVPVLRLTAGVSLIALGFQEKILDPGLGTQFLSAHNWNFMKALGMEWFTDRTFILSAGMTEVLFGVLYMTGLITRITTIAFGAVLLTTAIVLGIGEIIGHLPIFGIAVLLLVYGSGSRGVIANR